MFERISNGFAMARSSWSVLMGDKKLLLYPIVSGLLFLLVVASFGVPMGVLFQDGKVLDAQGQLQVWVYPVIFAFYFSTYFVMIFCNAALVSCLVLRFNGQEASLRDGFSVAMARLPQIAGWAFVSATVGLILQAIENAHEKIGYWVKALLGAAWSIMTYFVVPILVVEKTGPIESVKRSTALLKKTWGEALVGKIGLGLFLFLLALPIVLLFVVGLYLMQTSAALGAAVMIAAGIAMLLYMAISSALNTIFLTAVYQFAAHDRVPQGFERNAMAHAFTTK